jgi:hypothetical protein
MPSFAPCLCSLHSVLVPQNSSGYRGESNLLSFSGPISADFSEALVSTLLHNVPAAARVSMAEMMEPTRTTTPSLSREASEVGPESISEIMEPTRKIVVLPISILDIQSQDESFTADGSSSQVDNERSRSQSERDAETVPILKSS